MKKIIGRKAEWLANDKLAYINTNIKYDVNIDIVDNFQYISLYTTSNYGISGVSRAFWGLTGDRGKWASWEGSSKLVASVNTDYLVETDFKNSNYYINGQECGKGNYNTALKNNITLYFVKGQFDYHQHVRRRETIFKYNGNIILSLTPIQLTSSLPAYLASDNLPHSAGECGMWDSVNEKFYGNANSVGAFSVENELDEYVEVDTTGIAINGKYQRVSVENSEIPQIVWNGVNARMLMLNGEVVWLNKTYTYLISMSGTAVINLGTYNLVENEIEFDINKVPQDTLKKWDIARFRYIYGERGSLLMQLYEQPKSSGNLLNLMIFRNGGSSHLWEYKLQDGINQARIYVANKRPSCDFNGVTYNSTQSVSSFVVPLSTQGYIGAMRIGDLHFIPKMLLQPLPAESDSQGIARQPYTCGLWCEEQNLFYTSEDGQGFSVI